MKERTSKLLKGSTIFVSNRHRNGFDTVHRCVNVDLNLYCDFCVNYTKGWLVLEENQLQQIRIRDYEPNPDTYWIEEFKPNEGASAPFYYLQEFNGAEMFNATARRPSLRYGEETLTHLEDGGLFEDYDVEDWKYDKEVFKDLLSAISEDEWKVFDPTVHIVGGIVISNDFDVA